jgi:hypothetical protein
MGAVPVSRNPERPDPRRARGQRAGRNQCGSPIAAGPRDRLPRPMAAPGWPASLDRPSLLLRLRVFARRRALDVHLADGADPAGSAALAVRARQLIAPSTRESFASGLESLVMEAARPPLPRGMAIPLARRQLMEARATLLALAACLRSDRPVYARGVALLSWLLTDGTGPVYDRHARSDLHDVLASVAEALDGAGPTHGDGDVVRR